MNFRLFFLFLLFFLFINNTHSARELQIYADKIDYDSNENIVATGNVKIIQNNEILTSNIVIINNKEDKIILPKDFQFKDSSGNYTFGSSGEYSTNLDIGKVNDIKMLLNDGSRIVGSSGYKNKNLDLINKGVFSPCKSKINIKNFMCPIWQVEGEKILHDRDNLFIHTKHAKMRILNTPIYYFPYLISPSPLRKERKSGFLNPSISFDFIDTKTSQSISTPYYFAIDEDKELLLTPTIKYGGGVDSSQYISYNYEQITSGGVLSIDASTSTNLENENNETWLRDASISTNLNYNINETYNLSFGSSLQTSGTYLRRTDRNNPLSKLKNLTTSLNVNGYNAFENNDSLSMSVSSYQIVLDEDNKTTPTSLPYITYNYGVRNYKDINLNNRLIFYNLFRDKYTSDHAQEQQKIEYRLSANKDYYTLNSKITFNTEIYSQYYNIKNKKIDGEDFTGAYGRIFPMSGILLETPLINNKNDIYITPKIFLVLNSGQSNSNKISNEESTDYKYSLLNFSSLSRYTGTDKLENSRRLSYGFDVSKDKFKFEVGQSYEFNTKNNEYTKNVGLNDYMSDILGSASLDGNKNDLTYGFRFNVDQGLMQSHSLSISNDGFLGITGITYSQERKENNAILETGSEGLGLSFSSKEFINYSSVNFSSSFDLVEDDPTNYVFGYRYVDECFGLSLQFERTFYEDRDLKPKDILTLMFSFKHLGSYKSTNLAVSEEEKQVIQWDSVGTDAVTFK